MNLLRRLTIKNLKLNKKRTVVTIIGIILSVSLIAAVSAMYFSLINSLIAFEIKEKGNFHYAFYNVKNEDFKTFTKNRNIESYYMTKNIGYAKLLESKNVYKPYTYIKAFSKEALKNLGINLVEGRLPENNQEIIIPTHLKTNGRVVYKIGDTITLNIGNRVTEDGYKLDQSNPFNPEIFEEIVDNNEKTYKIVGIMERPSKAVESYTAPGYTFITYINDNEHLEYADIYTRYTKNALENESAITADILGVDKDAYKKLYHGGFYDADEFDSLQKKLGTPKYETSVNDYLISLETGIFKNNAVMSITSVVLIVVGIIIFTSVFCIKNSFSISITEKTKQYGMLSSIGATSKQIKKNVYYEALILGLIGIPIGIICGLLAAYILINISNLLIKGMINMGLTYTFSWQSILFAIILGFVTLYLSAWHSAHTASKISPINAIRNSKDIKINSKKIRSPKYIKKIFGIGGDVSYKNLKRNKKKYRATVISIIVCVSVFIALASFINLAFRYVKNEFEASEYNIEISYNNDQEKSLTTKIKEILKSDDIIDYSIVNNESVTMLNYKTKFHKEYLKYYPNINATYTYTDEFGNEKTEYHDNTIVVFSVGEEQYKKYIKELNLDYDYIKDKGILMNYIENYSFNKGKEEKTIIPVYDYKEKEVITVYNKIITTDSETGNNKYIDKEHNIEIGKITETLPFGFHRIYGNPIIILSDEYFDKLFEKTELYTNIYINTKNASKLQDEIDVYLSDYDYGLTNIEENVKMMTSFYTLIAIFLYGFITVIALIGITNIFNTITTNMELRSREFATLKSIGMTKKEFNRMIRLESFFYGTKSLLIGIPIGCVLSYIIHIRLNENDASIRYEPPMLAIIISILAVFILITCIMKYTINKINKQNTIETIRNENI